MKVLVCIPCLLTGGTEIQTLSLVKALVRAGHEVTTACYFEHSPEMATRYERTGSRVVLCSADGSRPVGVKATAVFLHKALRKAVKEVRPDVAHVQYMAPGAIPIIILRWIGVKRILATAHTAADIYSSLWLPHFLSRHVLTAFTCITERAERSFFGTSTLYAPDTPMMHRGNHFTIYNNLPSYITIAREPKPFDGQTVIGVVSRLEKIKGMDLVVPAFARIHATFGRTRLLIVGDGSLKETMRKQMEETGLADCITFAGRQPQEHLQRHYDNIDILLMPSRSEGFGLTAIEGMARGCVVVAADVGGLPEVVTDGETGLLHRREDGADMAEKVMNLLAAPGLMRRMSRQAIERVRIFSTDRYNRLIADLYSRICIC